MKKLVTLAALFVLVFTFSANAQKFGIQASAGLPMGDFSSVLNASTGFGGTATYFYGVEGGFILTGSLGYVSFSTDPDMGSYSMVPISVGARYPFSQGEFMPYGGLEAGYTIFSFSSNVAGFSLSVAENSLAFAPMAGFSYELNKGLNLDVNAKYHLILTSGSTTSFVGINAGVVFEL